VPFTGLDLIRVKRSATPLYDALVNEYRLALRTVPGDRGLDEGLTTRLSPVGYCLVPAARRPPIDVPRQLSRHRGAPGDDPAPY
jgi:hypothetical protein